MTTATTEGKRTAELTVDLKASPAVVWKALTDAQELTRWFPMDSRVKPGVGGSIWNSWDSDLAWESPITIWEPDKRLRLIWGPPPAPGTPEAELFGVDFFIEDKGGGSTRLRLVHFGFSKDPSWDGMYDGVSRGWDFMMWTLTEYLEKHLGTPRNVVFLRAKLGSQSGSAAWERAFSNDGLLPSPGLRTLKPGEKFKVRVAGEELAGRVRRNIAGKDFQASIESLGGATLRVQVDACQGGPQEEMMVTLGMFGIEASRIEKLRMAWVDGMARMFG